MTMKTRSPSHRRARVQDAFTLAEFMVMSGVFIMMMAAIMAAHLYGLKMSARVGVQLGASDDARQTLSKLIADIRDAQTVDVGNGSSSGWTNVADGSAQQGSGLMIYPGNTVNLAQTNSWIRYYYAPDLLTGQTNALMRLDNTGATTNLTANYVTNDLPIFKKVDYAGNVSTSQAQKPFCIEITLSFIRLANPQIPIGAGGTNMFDFYQVLTRVSPRNQ